MRRVKQGADVPQNTSQPLFVSMAATMTHEGFMRRTLRGREMQRHA